MTHRTPEGILNTDFANAIFGYAMLQQADSNYTDEQLIETIGVLLSDHAKKKSELDSLKQELSLEDKDHFLKHGPMFIDSVRPILEGFAKKQIMISKAAELLNTIAREYASIQSDNAKPSLQWVKVKSEKDLPEDKVLYEIGWQTGDRKYYFGRTKKVEQGDGRILRYLSESPSPQEPAPASLPSVESCIEYSKTNGPIMSTEDFKRFINFCQTPKK